ncbi:hypothetical protein MKW92_025286 [Papaver armeniacum]|nr:hypothetical protein MKW92_025286 [Papaver armeniacum]
MDPLSALRDFTIRGELDKIVKVNDEFRFGKDYSFPCSAETAYRSKQGNLYTIETLIYYIKNHHIKHTEYLQNARIQKIPSVTLPDRKPLLEYLQGKVLSNDAIEFVVPQHPKADSVPFDIEEYRPDDPGMLRGDAQMGGDVEDDKTRVHEKIDYVEKIRSMERPLKDRELLLECRQRDFYTVLVASTRREEERQRLESQQRKDGLVAKSRLMGSDDRGFWKDGEDAGKIGEGVPIILVPSASQTLITIYNVKEFLEDGVFIPTDVKIKQMQDRVVTAYEVRDKPSALKAEDWDRVVAVFVLGKEWQFKDWPFKDHVEIFNKIIGFFLRFEDDSIESAKIVKQWNVKIISISKNKRHQDKTAALEVWGKLEEFVRSRSHN